MAATADEIAEAFQEFDIEVDDDEVIAKMEELSVLFTLDAEALVNEWLAYQSRNQNRPLTYTELEQLERELTSTRAKSRAIKKELPSADAFSHGNQFSNQDSSTNAIDIIESYCSPKNRGKLRKIHVNTTPITPDRKQLADISISPTVFSPMANGKSASQKYTSRTTAGEVVAHLHDGDVPDESFWSSSRQRNLNIKMHERNIQKTYKYMFQKVMDVSDFLNEVVETCAEELQQQCASEIDSYAPCCSPSQSEVVVIGRIKNETHGRLTPLSVVMEGDRVNSFGRSVNIDLERLSEYSLFPGQVVAMRGINPTGKKFIASRVFTPISSSGHMAAGVPNDLKDDDDKVVMMVAAGPFTTSDSLSYEPLLDFIAAVKQNCPDVAVIIGPLVDCSHEDIEKGMIDQPFADFARKWITYIMNALQDYTQLVFVPSQRDVFHHPVYPQPPYTEKKSTNCHFVANPSSFYVGNIHVGVTSTDVLFHLGAEEISKCQPSSSTDRLARLASHLLNQRSFYPLYPAHDSVSVDMLGIELAGHLPSDLDIVLLPSDLRCFVKCLNGRLCINPGRLAKGVGGGTFTRIVVGGSNKTRAVAQVVKI